MKALKIDTNIIWLIFIGAIVFIPFIGSVHLFDWDEINFAESAREMILSGNYLDVQINFETFWEKPPLFIWMQSLSMKIFGINEFAARFPNAICGVFSIVVLYLIGKSLKNKLLGIIWALVYLSSLLPFFYFKSGIIDPWFNLFIFLGIWFMVLYTQGYHQLNTLRVILSATFIGLSILTKGPVSILIFAIVTLVFIAYRKFHVAVRWYDVLIFILVLSLVGGFWFLLQIFNGNYNILQQFLEYQIRLFSTQDAGHGGNPLYHFVVLFFGVFPASVFALREFVFRDRGNIKLRHMHTWTVILFFTVLIIFTIVKTKIVHYSSLCYFPLTYLAAQRIYRIYVGSEKIKIFEKILFGTIAIVLALVAVAFSLIQFYLPELLNSDIIKDDFAVANLQSTVLWTGVEFVPALIILISVIAVFILFSKKMPKRALLVIFTGMLCFQLTAMKVLLPRVEEITQKTAIDFYKSLPEDQVYLETIGFKSYAHLFYFKKPLPKGNLNYTSHQLLWSDIDKPSYFVSKITLKEEILQNHPQLTVVDEKNGFVFYKREIQ